MPINTEARKAIDAVTRLLQQAHESLDAALSEIAIRESLDHECCFTLIGVIGAARMVTAQAIEAAPEVLQSVEDDSDDGEPLDG